jgi:hypothetical protein
MSTCQRHFIKWAARLENEPEPWGIRSIRDGLCFHNLAMRRMLGTQRVFLMWEECIADLHTEEREHIEDVHSEVMKTGQSQTFHMRGTTTSVILSRCDGCANACGVIVSAFAQAPAPA